jgi:hypothetical protein
VFLDFTQEQLDKAYDQSFWAPNMAELEAADGATSAEVRRKMPPRTERYGASDVDLIDIFTPPNPRGVPVLVFIHGGAWTRNSRQDASFPAPTLVGRGAAYLAPDFGSLKTIRLPEMIENCRRALEWTVRNADRLARAVGLDMVEVGWEPTVDNYLGRVTKPRILEAVREAKGEQATQLIDHLKKAEMAKEAERLLDGTGWLPEPLRLADSVEVSDRSTDTVEALPAFLADGEGQDAATDETEPHPIAAE